MTKIEQLIRADLLDIESYQVKQRKQNDIWLDMNELPWDVGNASFKNYNRYPIVNDELISKVASYYEVKPSQVLLTRGSDDAIDLLIRLFCTPFTDKIMICPPTFPMYALNAKYQGVDSQKVPLQSENNFTLDINKVLSGTTKTTKLLFLCSPNNPTATSVSVQDILTLCGALQANTIVVVDEAYIEFSNNKSGSEYIDQCPNLVVLRTFSKAFGLAGIRCGTVLANEAIIRYLRKISPPFALSQPTIEALSIALQPEFLTQIKNTWSVIQQERERLIETISQLSFVKQYWESAANFILMAVDNADKVVSFCANQGIAIKNCHAKPLLDNCIRISIGTPLQNEKLLQILDSYGASC